MEKIKMKRELKWRLKKKKNWEIEIKRSTENIDIEKI
jgi:hypothetical protein